MAVGAVAVKRLGALPVIGAYLERLGVKERVDALAPVRGVAHLTNGDVVAALVANRLTAPRPLYDIVDWAEEWAVEETFGIRPADLNDDRLGRCLDDIAAVHDRLRGRSRSRLWLASAWRPRRCAGTLTSVVVTGAYPAEEQHAGYARLQYGYGGGDQKQVRYLQVTTDDGAVPIWDQVHDGNTADVATVVQTMRALREHAGCTDFVLVGDSKLLSAPTRAAMLTAGVGYLAPLARTPDLDAAFLAIPPADLVPLEYVSQRERGKPAEQRASYQGWDSTVEVRVTTRAGEVQCHTVRRLFVVSSEERDAARRNRARCWRQDCLHTVRQDWVTTERQDWVVMPTTVGGKKWVRVVSHGSARRRPSWRSRRRPGPCRRWRRR